MNNIPIKLQKAYMLVVLLKEYYNHHPTGGCVHIITDDLNYGKEYAQQCLDYAIEQKDFWGEQIARLFLEFNAEEQEQINERSWEITIQIP